MKLIAKIMQVYKKLNKYLEMNTIHRQRKERKEQN